MKYIPSMLMYFLRNRTAKRNIFLLLKFFLILGAIVTAYSIMFHVLMLLEGKEFSWITGLYWTLTVMSTLGFGDITFKSDLGLVFFNNSAFDRNCLSARHVAVHLHTVFLCPLAESPVTGKSASRIAGGHNRPCDTDQS